MPRKRIAPTLRHVHPRPLTGMEMAMGKSTPMVTYMATDAYRELMALLAVARAAMRAGPYHYSKDDLAMGRALRRLERVSGGAK